MAEWIAAAAVVVAAVPAGQSPGDVNGAAMAANPSIGAPKADIDKDVASLTGRSGADMAKMQDLPGPQPEVSAVATVAPAVSTAAIALSDPGLQPPLILPPDVAIFALPPSASTTEPAWPSSPASPTVQFAVFRCWPT